MLTYFPKYFSSRAIYCYIITLALVSVIFIKFAMPFQFMLFGFVAVIVFFVYGNRLTLDWQRYSPETFTKRLFVTALVIRLVYVIFIYFYYIDMTGKPHAYNAADELVYQYWGTLWKEEGFLRMKAEMNSISFSDVGYPWWLGFEYLLLGTHVFPARIIKCFLSAFICILMYNFAKRNFGESVGRVTGIFCMLMPNMWYYCGVTLKETEMAF